MIAGVGLGLLNLMAHVEASVLAKESGSGSLFLLILGPGAGFALYWMLYRYYRNIDKSYQFERETLIQAQPVTGQDAKVGEVTGVTNSKIEGRNERQYRTRVQRY